MRGDVFDPVFEGQPLAVRPGVDLIESGGYGIGRAAVPAAGI
jgi:hypothetical protein